MRHETEPAAQPMQAARNGDTTSRMARLGALGALLGAAGASACCIAPLALFSLGVTGAWIGNLTALAPYQPVFAVFAIGALGVGFYAAYKRPKPACGDGCARPRPGRLVRTSLWGASALTLLALIYPYVAPSLLGI